MAAILEMLQYMAYLKNITYGFMKKCKAFNFHPSVFIFLLSVYMEFA